MKTWKKGAIVSGLLWVLLSGLYWLMVLKYDVPDELLFLWPILKYPAYLVFGIYAVFLWYRVLILNLLLLSIVVASVILIISTILKKWGRFTNGRFNDEESRLEKKERTLDEKIRPKIYRFVLIIALYFILAYVLNIRSLVFLFVGTSLSYVWHHLTQPFPIHYQQFFVVIPEDSVSLAPYWEFRVAVFLGMIFKVVILYFVAGQILHLIRQRKQVEEQDE